MILDFEILNFGFRLAGKFPNFKIQNPKLARVPFLKSVFN